MGGVHGGWVCDGEQSGEAGPGRGLCRERITENDGTHKISYCRQPVYGKHHLGRAWIIDPPVPLPRMLALAVRHIAPSARLRWLLQYGRSTLALPSPASNKGGPSWRASGIRR